MMVKKVFIIFLACCFFSTTVSMNAFLYAEQNTNDIGSPKEQLEQFMQEYLSSEAKIGISQSSDCDIILAFFVVSYISLLAGQGVSLPSEIARSLFFRYLNCLSEEGNLIIVGNKPCNTLLLTALFTKASATDLILLILHYIICVQEPIYEPG
jgi:hypothetical protein